MVIALSTMNLCIVFAALFGLLGGFCYGRLNRTIDTTGYGFTLGGVVMAVVFGLELFFDPTAPKTLLDYGTVGLCGFMLSAMLICLGFGVGIMLRNYQRAAKML
jgi:hypothetical protein